MLAECTTIPNMHPLYYTVMSPVSTPEDTGRGGGDSDLLAIIAGAAGGVVASVSAIIAAIVCVVLCRRRRKEADKQDTQDSTVYYNYDTMDENLAYATIDDVLSPATTSTASSIRNGVAAQSAVNSFANGLVAQSSNPPTQNKELELKNSLVMVQNEAYGNGLNRQESEYDYIN